MLKITERSSELELLKQVGMSSLQSISDGPHVNVEKSCSLYLLQLLQQNHFLIWRRTKVLLFLPCIQQHWRNKMILQNVLVQIPTCKVKKKKKINESLSTCTQTGLLCTKHFSFHCLTKLKQLFINKISKMQNYNKKVKDLWSWFF